MNEFKEYLKTLKNPAEKQELERMRSFVYEVLPSVTETTSYGMPAFAYKGKAFLSFAVTKHFLSLYPFSGQIITDMSDKLKNYETTKGSIHFSVQNPISDELLKEIIIRRSAKIS